MNVQCKPCTAAVRPYGASYYDTSITYVQHWTIIKVLVRTRVSCSLVLALRIPGNPGTAYIPANRLQNQRHGVLFCAQKILVSSFSFSSKPCTAIVCPYGASYYVPGTRYEYSVLIQVLVRLESRVAPFHVQHTWYLVHGTSEHKNRLQHQRYGGLFRAEKILASSYYLSTGVYRCYKQSNAYLMRRGRSAVSRGTWIH